MSKNKNLQKAKNEKNDEFYTQLADIEKECEYYEGHFRGKTIYCNCDDPRVSNFFKYFSLQFERLGLKKLITTCYKNQHPDLFSRHDVERAICLEYTGDKDGNRMPDPHEIKVHDLRGNGDFRSPECIDLLKEADIVVTNPPFSLFRKYVAQLIEYEKKFLIIGNVNSVSTKEIFPLIKEGKMWWGVSKRGLLFDIPLEYAKRLGGGGGGGAGLHDCGDGRLKKSVNAVWYTNLEHSKRNEGLTLYRKYSSEEYPKYDNYNAIEVSKVRYIPENWEGPMGVPITFLDCYNPEQFEILGSDYDVKQGLLPGIVNPEWDGKIDRGYIEGRRKSSRILIRNKKVTK